MGRRNGTVNSENYEIKDVLFRENLWNFLSIFLLLTISIPLNVFQEVLIISTCFNVCRLFTGGYHTQNLTFCFCISVLQFSVFALISKHLPINILYLQILTILSILYTFYKAPVINMEFEEEKSNVEVVQSKFNFLLFASSFFIWGTFLDRSLASAVYYSIIIISPFMSGKTMKMLDKIRLTIFKK